MKQVTASLDKELSNDLACLRRATLMPSVSGIVRAALRQFIDRTVRDNRDVGARYAAEKAASAKQSHLRIVK